MSILNHPERKFLRLENCMRPNRFANTFPQSCLAFCQALSQAQFHRNKMIKATVDSRIRADAIEVNWNFTSFRSEFMTCHST